MGIMLLVEFLGVIVLVIGVCWGNNCVYLPHDCQELQDSGHNESCVYRVFPYGMNSGYNVYCDMTTDNGGWLVFQRREDGSVDFFKGWDAYQIGFGEPSGEYWLGNLALHAITRSGFYELRVDLEDWEGNTTYAKYYIFEIGSSSQSYRLFISGYSGNAGDSLSFHNGAVFSTKDRDVSLDKSQEYCAKLYKGAWWYNGCHESNLNGLYLNGSHPDTYYGQSVQWKTLKEYNYSLRKTEMKIRRI